eukprot:96906_1
MATLETILRLLTIITLSLAEQKCPDDIQQTLTDCTKNATDNADWDGVILCAHDYKEKCIESVEHLSNKDAQEEYDITINPNLSFLRKLGTDGWPIKLSKKLKMETNACSEIIACDNQKNTKKTRKDCLKKVSSETRINCVTSALDIKGCFIPWIGGFNVGKTFLLNQVTGKKFKSSFGKDGETRGVNFILPAKHIGMKLIHIDTPGVLRSVPPQDLRDRYLTDKFVKDLMPDIGDRIVLVVDILTSDDQVLVSQLMDQIAAFTTVQRPKRLYVLHNFKNLESSEEVDIHINTDIVRAFTAQKDTVDDVDYWTHSVHKLQVFHFVFAAQHSEAGKKWNKRSLKQLKQWLNHPCTLLELNILDHFLSKLTPLLREYFPPNITQDRLGTDYMSGSEAWDIFTRTRNWVGSFFQFNEPSNREVEIVDLLPDRGTDPFKLKLIASNGEDVKDFEAKIALETLRDLEYCNFTMTQLGDLPQCHPEPDCALLTSKDTWKVQCIIPTDFANSYTNLTAKFSVVIDKDEMGKKPSELKIFGTILPPWKKYLAEGEKLELRYADTKMFGWFSRAFQLPRQANRYLKNKISSFNEETGVFTVIIPVSKSGIEIAKQNKM